MISYRRVLASLRGFSPIYDTGKERLLHLLLAQYLVALFGRANVKIYLAGKKGIDILLGASIAIEVKRRLPTKKTLYRQLKMYRKMYRQRKIILYVYGRGVDKVKREELKRLREKGVVDKIIINTMIPEIEYESRKDKYIISPKPKLIEIP